MRSDAEAWEVCCTGPVQLASVGLLGRAAVEIRPETWAGTGQAGPGHGGLWGPAEGPVT